jgi:hypothetical protein
MVIMALTQAGTKPAVEYPSTDGEPMAQNTKQYRYITTIQGGLAAMFRDRPDVFVAADLFWYPIEGDNTTRAAPDVMVVFGRPKGVSGRSRNACCASKSSNAPSDWRRNCANSA